MDSVENMQDFNIPFIENDVPTVVEELSLTVTDNPVSPTHENKSESPPVAQETDNEALSSLLMLSKSNADQVSKSFTGEAIGISVDTETGKAAAMTKAVPKRAPPSADRTVRGDSQPLSKSVKMEDLRKFFHLPIVEVARQLGTCTTALKKICRKNKINKWPYRQIRSITKSIQSLEMASLNDTLPEDLRIQYRQQIVTLQNAIDELIKDPNGVIQLVNMGLSEEALQHLRESSAGGKDDDFDAPLPNLSLGAQKSQYSIHSTLSHHVNHSSHTNTNSSAGLGNNISSKYNGYSLTASNNGGAQGVLNLLQWPKPSADVQQIMQAAAQLTTQTDSQTAARRISHKAKRKSSEAGLDGGNSDEHVIFDDSAAGEKHGEDVLDLNQLEGGNLRHKKVEIGDTVAECVFVAESQRMVFSGPVHLAPLQRKKLKPNITRKVVPLMEPDIGSNFGIEFIPQFILNILHSAIGSSNVMSESHRQQLLQQQQLQQQAQQQIYHQDASMHTSHSNNSIDAVSIEESIHNYINDSSNYASSPAVYDSSNSASNNMYGSSSGNNVGNSHSNAYASHTSHPYSHHTSANTNTSGGSMYPTTHYSLEPAASQAAAHLVSLNLPQST